ncbi:hypothetical protein [Jiulongibacter sediminis]|uniref:hypothetical protein n=1 Tax=Jiulongibacter sediminis TaxID=1605367 RepID=UPI0026EA3120|nr:hypothetical protein [Jiulongibacter sediminis]
MKIALNDISELITQTIDSIQKGLPQGFEITDDIRFEVQVITDKTSKGGMDIKLLNAGSEKHENLSHKISFEVSPSVNKEQRLAETLKGIESLILGITSSFKNVSQAIERNDDKQLS